MDYRSIFEARGHRYNRAMERCPDARAEEARLLLEDLGDPGPRFCDAPAGGGFVAGVVAAAHPEAEIVCVEPSARFATGIPGGFDTRVCALECIDLPAASVSSVASLAGTHHLPAPEKFFREARRVLAPGGRFAVADVARDTPTARWLNDSVNRLNPQGHEGCFYAPGELAAALAQAGFDEARERFCTYSWRFPDPGSAVEFFREMFGLEASGTVIEKELTDVLEPFHEGAAFCVPWSLVYARGDAPRG